MGKPGNGGKRKAWMDSSYLPLPSLLFSSSLPREEDEEKGESVPQQTHRKDGARIPSSHPNSEEGEATCVNAGEGARRETSYAAEDRRTLIRIPSHRI